MLDSPTRNDEEIKTILADIKRADQRATDVIMRLRRLFSKSGVEAQDVALNETVGEVIGILAAQAAAHNVTLKTSLIPQPLIVKGDRVQLEQVILNLVANAIDALAEAGRTIAGSRFVSVYSMRTLRNSRFRIMVRGFGPIS
jgi:C4-dicarboxylate-specific signal transduction histidine kinase